MNELKTKKISMKTDLKLHLVQSLKNRWILATLMFSLTIFMSLLLITNIKAIEYITALLVSKSVIDSANDYEKLISFLKEHMGLTAEEIDFIARRLSWLTGAAKDEFIQELVKNFFYDNVNYADGTLFITVWGYNLNLYTLVYVMITDISLIVLAAYIIYIIAGFIAKSYESKLRKQLIDKLIDQDLDFFNKRKTGELINALVKDSAILSKYIKDGPVNYTLSIVTIIISSIMMFNINWKLASCVFGLLGIFMVLIFCFIFITNSSTKKIHQTSQKLDNNITEKIYNIRLIKSSGTFNKEKSEFSETINLVDKKDKKKLFLSEISNALIVGGIGSFSMASIIFGVILFYNDTQSLISIMTAFTAGVIVMTLPILQLRQVISDGPAAKIAATSVTEVLDSKILIDKHQPLVFDEEVNSIEFQDLTFNYPESDQAVFTNMNFKLEKNNKYAFVGPTGSGKSTIAKLVLRFYDSTAGMVKINDHYDLKSLNLKSWLDKIGYVDQEPQILSGTIYANIAYGLENVSKEEIIAAAKKAKLHDLILTWSDGYDTILFERGAQLSGGQKQRLVIARLILKDPEILILDEATSALDNLVEAEIQRELEKLMVGRTTISIAHRLSTIKSFDKIFVIEPDQGIVQTGTFDELIKKPGLFKKLYDISN